ncbi:hypothetical protein BDV06DRAFT_208783 [Aspergillus oleicola]
MAEIVGIVSEISRGHDMTNVNNAMQLSAQYCSKAALSLETLVNKLSKKVEDKNRLRRNKARLKVVFEQDDVQYLEREMQGALQLLSIAQQTYLMALVRQQPPLVVAQVGSVGIREESRQLLPSSSPEPARRGTTTGVVTETKITRNPLLPWVYSRFFGSYTSRSSRRNGSKTSATSEEIYCARVQPPSWLAQSAWDIWAKQASNGWNYSIRCWNIKPGCWNDKPGSWVIDPWEDGGTLGAAYRGNVSCIIELCSNGTGSLFDRDTQGRTLLHYAALGGDHDTFNYLVQEGLSIYEPTFRGHTPLWYLCHHSSKIPVMVNIHRFLRSTGDLTDMALSLLIPDLPYGDVFHTCSLIVCLWSVPGIFDLIIDEFRLAPLDLRFRSIAWKWTDPKLLLDIFCRDKLTDPATFRRQTFEIGQSSLPAFASVYFQHVPEFYGAKVQTFYHRTGIFEDWRKIARWLVHGISLEDLSYEGNDSWEARTPLLYGLWKCSWVKSTSSLGLRQTRQMLKKALSCWLEDLRNEGIDLKSYGRREKKMFHKSEEMRSTRWRKLTFAENDADAEEFWGECGGIGPILVEIKTGPLPSDWELVWDLYGEAYAGEFFEWAECDRPLMPGTWDADDIF